VNTKYTSQQNGIADNKNTTLNKGWAGKNNFVLIQRNIYFSKYDD
jgi:hypothetical protein